VIYVRVYKTKDYKKFKRVKGNRDMSLAQIQKLVRSTNEEDLSASLPVIVNEKMEVVDGQHRIQAAKKRDKHVHYIVVEGADLNTVQLLNSNTKSWGINDYIRSYVERGYDHYETLLSFMSEFSLPATISASILSGRKVDAGGGVGTIIKTGRFEANGVPKARKIGRFVVDCKKHVDSSLGQSRDFIRSLIETFDVEGIENKRFLQKLSTYYGIEI